MATYSVGKEANGLAMEEKSIPLGMKNGTELESEQSSHAKKSCPRLFWDNLTRRDLGHFRKYIDSTTTHGLPRIFTGKSIIRRLFWLVLFLAAAGGCLYNCITQIMFLASFPTSTRIEFERQTQLDFPAITVCNNNFASRPNLESIQLADYFECLSTFSSLGFEKRTQLFRNCSRRFLDNRQMDVPISNVYRNGAQSARDFIVDCSWPSTTAASSCSYENFTQVVTSSGVCYRLNGDRIRRALAARGVGRRFAITLLLDVQQYNYLNLTDEAGVLVAIHPRPVPPRPLQTGIAVPPGSSADISMRFVQYNFPDQTCGGNRDSLNFFNIYSVPHCVLDHQYSEVADTCRCLDPASPPPKRNTRYAILNYTDCTMSRYGCLSERLLNATEAIDCKQECTNGEFNPKVSYFDFPSQSSAYDSSTLPLQSATDPKNNLVQVRIFYEDFLVQNVIEEPSYDVIRLLADIGGQLGLFLGVSIISITEFLTWVLDELKDRLLCVNSCKQRARRRKTEKFKPANGQNELSLTNPVAISS